MFGDGTPNDLVSLSPAAHPSSPTVFVHPPSPMPMIHSSGHLHHATTASPCTPPAMMIPRHVHPRAIPINYDRYHQNNGHSTVPPHSMYIPNVPMHHSAGGGGQQLQLHGHPMHHTHPPMTTPLQPVPNHQHQIGVPSMNSMDVRSGTSAVLYPSSIGQAGTTVAVKKCEWAKRGGIPSCTHAATEEMKGVQLCAEHYGKRLDSAKRRERDNSVKGNQSRSSYCVVFFLTAANNYVCYIAICRKVITGHNITNFGRRISIIISSYIAVVDDMI